MRFYLRNYGLKMETPNIFDYKFLKTDCEEALREYNALNDVLKAFHIIEKECYMTDKHPDKEKAMTFFNLKKEKYEKLQDNVNKMENGMQKFFMIIEFNENREVWLCKCINKDK